MPSTRFTSPSRSTTTSSAGTGATPTPVSGMARLPAVISRVRSSSMKKPPEPLRRAVADLLSSSSSTTFSSISALSSHHHASSPSVHASEASRTLRDYLAAPSTTDLAYCVILEHTLAERDRSPAVVSRCVALLKRYLLRYKPSEETLLQIDRFCVHIISECDIGLSRKFSPWSHSLNQQSKDATKALPSSSIPMPVSSFASSALIKSLNYVRSLVAQYIPKRSFQPAAFAGPLVSRQFLPSLSSLLSRSFSSQLSPASNGESSGRKDASFSVPSHRKTESFNVTEDVEYVSSDVLQWRWVGDQQSIANLVESDHNVNTQDLSKPNLLEIGAASILVADMDGKKEDSWKHYGTADMPYLDQLLQPSSSSSGSSASVRHQLRIITASKRTKSSSQEIWEDCSVGTFHPRARPLFQYRHYSEQQPLKLNPTEVGEVIEAVFSEDSLPNVNQMTISTGLSNHRTRPSIDVAASVLIKLVIDMYVLDPDSAAPLTLSMLEDMVTSPRLSARTRAFDMILNLGVHAHLLEPVVVDDVSTIAEDFSQDSSSGNETQLEVQTNKTDSYNKTGDSSAIDKLESWILNILYEILVLLVQVEEKEESVWASALSCLLYFVCDRGRIRRSRLKGLDIRVLKALIEISRINSWAEAVHSKLISMLATMFYEHADDQDSSTSNTHKFLAEQVDLIGGVDFIFMEYSLAKTREESRNLYSLLLDYVLHLISVEDNATGITEYESGEIKLIAMLLSLANAPEAFHISVKLGVQGIGELLRRSVSAALSRYSDSEQLSIILEKITSKFDAIISSFTFLEKEFSNMRQITKSCKHLKAIEDGAIGKSISWKAKQSWVTLHSLLHSERVGCRKNGYIWLGDLLISEISEERDGNMLLNISSLKQQIYLAGIKDPSDAPDIPLSIWLMCGLLKSKNCTTRAGFLFVLEVLLMRCKFLLDEKELENSANTQGNHHGVQSLEKAKSVIDIMSSCLSLVPEIHERDHFNILKMCDILFSQLCLKVPSASTVKSGDAAQIGRGSRNRDASNVDIGKCVPLQENVQRRGLEDDDNLYSSLNCETSSMAALLLQGRAVVPLQLVSRVPAVLFYWPLIQLAGAATDNIALGVSVGSKGRGNLPGATSDIRAALLLLLIAKCTADSSAFEDVDGEDFFRQLLEDTDSRVAYYSSAFLLKRMMTADFENYQRSLQKLLIRAQQSNNEKLLENPYLQMRGILQLSNDLLSGL